MRAQEDGSAGKSMKQNTSGYLLALLAVVIWSGNFVVARAVADMIPPWQCNFWRWFTAFVTILPFAWRHLREDWPALRRHWRFVVVMSLLGVTLMNTFFYKAGQSTESLNMALIAPTAPIIILIFSRLLYGEAITPRRLLGMLVVATGIVILVSRGDMERLAALRFAPGDLWSLGGAASFGLYSLFMRHRGTDLSVFGFSAARAGRDVLAAARAMGACRHHRRALCRGGLLLLFLLPLDGRHQPYRARACGHRLLQHARLRRHGGPYRPWGGRQHGPGGGRHAHYRRHPDRDTATTAPAGAQGELMNDNGKLRVVLATHNAGKIRELADPMADFGIEVVGLSLFPEIGEIEETGTTFEENALIKARAVCAATGLVAVADDSGLEVDALDKGPGVYSARYSNDWESLPGESVDKRNMRKLLFELRDVPQARRSCRFVSCMVAVHPDGRELVVRGTWEGRILEEPLGENGFGYDPLFWDESIRKSAAQLTRDEKNARSHRGNALRALLARWSDFMAGK